MSPGSWNSGMPTRPSRTTSTPSPATPSPQKIRMRPMFAGSLIGVKPTRGVVGARRAVPLHPHRGGAPKWVPDWPKLVVLHSLDLWQPRLRRHGRFGWRQSEVRIGAGSGHAALTRAFDETELEQVGLDHVHDRVGLLADGGGDRLQADRPDHGRGR